MSTEQALKTVTYEAAADLSTKQYHFVHVDTNGRVALSAEGSGSIGVLQDKPAAAGRAAAVGIDGITKVVAGGSVSKGDRLTVDSTGRAVAYGSGDDYSMGVAREAGSTGVIINMLLQKTGQDQR